MSVSAGRDGLCSRQPWSSVRCRCRTLSFTAAITVSSDLIVCMSKKCRARSRQRPRQANRFAWRGLCLDLARHFFDMQTIKSLLTVMAAVKLNVLHLHLTDDQGWRLQSPSRPALTDISGATAVGGDPGGFLTVGDYTDLIAHAAARGITIVPEIDIPGHVNAALHAYGDLTARGTPTPAYTGVGVGFSRLDPELPATAPFIAAVLAGARVLLSPASRLYLDMRYDDATPVGQDWAGHITLRDCYDWEPADLSLIH